MALTTALGGPVVLVAQASFQDLDFGHPARIQDASVPALGALIFYLPTIGMERLPTGVTRWRSEPGVTLGVGWKTSVELFSPVVFREQGVTPRVAIAGTGVSLLHAWTREHGPSLAVAVNSVFPVGAAASARVTYGIRGLATLPLSSVRLHANASVGSYAVALTGNRACGTLVAQILGIQCDGSSTPVLPPCAIAADAASGVLQRAALCSSNSPPPPKLASGRRYQFAVGFDRTFTSSGTLLLVNVFGERFQDLLPKTDVTAELGVRHRLRSTLVLDAGVGRRFTGNGTSWQLTTGLVKTYQIRK